MVSCRCFLKRIHWTSPSGGVWTLLIWLMFFPGSWSSWASRGMRRFLATSTGFPACRNLGCEGLCWRQGKFVDLFGLMTLWQAKVRIQAWFGCWFGFQDSRLQRLNSANIWVNQPLFVCPVPLTLACNCFCAEDGDRDVAWLAGCNISGSTTTVSTTGYFFRIGFQMFHVHPSSYHSCLDIEIGGAVRSQGEWTMHVENGEQFRITSQFPRMNW